MPALTLHLDINGTCTPIDNTDVALTPEQCVNMYLSKSCFGMAVCKETAGGERTEPVWVAAPWPHLVDRAWATEHNNKEERESDIVSHYDFLRHTRQPKTLAHSFCAQQVPQMRHEQARDNIGSMCVRLLEFYAPGTSPLFPSVLELLRVWPQAKLIFRTFGVDAPHVVSCLRDLHQVERTFVGFKLTRSAPAEAKEEEPLFQLVGADDNRPVLQQATALQVGDFLEALPTDAYIIDDYAYWNAHGRTAAAGKPIFPVSGTKRSTCGRILQLGLDDNDCMYEAGPSTATCALYQTRINPLDPLRNLHFFTIACGTQLFRMALGSQANEASKANE